ncbi:hypothetical protein C8F01DRAFT_1379617 [Mycena amicta]|nr:hypothetical protein C8F01DRAFT_1379617 [Mycena amicta]
MSDNALPDEVLSEILAPALKVDDEAFSDTTSKASPFATYTESAAVVLRSKAQAKALQRSLGNNPGLGQFIKQLRIEGGYGAPMHRILQLSPNISHLYLTLVLDSGDSTDGLCKVLALISPTSFILYDTIDISPQANHKMARNLVAAIVDTIPGCQKLSTFHWPYMVDPDLPDQNDRWESIAQPLIKAQKLHTLTIVIKQRLTELDLSYHLDKVDPVLKPLLVYRTWRNVTPAPGTMAPELEPSLNPFYKPMSNVSEEVQDRIWSRILYFALYVPELPELQMIWESESPDIPDKRVTLLTLSSRFQRLGIPHLCVNVCLYSKSSLDSFARLLSKNAYLKGNIRSLVVHEFGLHIPLDRVVEQQATMQRILPGIDGLRHLSSIANRLEHTEYYASEATIAWNTFLAVDFGRLQELSIRIEAEQLASTRVVAAHLCCCPIATHSMLVSLQQLLSK